MSPHLIDRRPLTVRKTRTRVAATSVIAAVALSTVGFAAPSQAAVGTDAAVLINEVYGGGGNSGATLKNDFVELVNVSDAAVDLSTWSIQYASAGGASWNAAPLTGSIAAGGSYLVQFAAGTGGTEDLPTPDATGTINLSGSTGKVALVSSTTALSGATGNAHTAATVVDFVGWGSGASDFAGAATGGTAAPGTSNSTSLSRSATNANTANNGADFTAGAPTPTASQSGGTDPGTDPGTPAVVTIAEIQGTGDASPLAGTTVTTEGVVTASYPTGGFNGYVIQTPGTGGAGDIASRTASDAVFVYAPGAVGEVAIGQTVRVTGDVSEFFGLTQIRVAAGAAAVIADAAPVLPLQITWPATVAQRETVESMLVAPQGPFTVTNTYSTNQFGSVGLAAGTTPLRQPTDAARPGSDEAAAIAADNAARAVTLDDGASQSYLAAANRGLTPPYLSLTEPIIVGASATLTAPLIVDFRNSEWRFNPVEPLVGDGTGKDDGVTFADIRTEKPENVGGDMSVAAFNVLNYFTTLGQENSSCVAYTDRTGNGNNVNTGCPQRGAWDDEDFARQEQKIVAAIEALDASVVGLLEIENSGALGEQADEATATLVAALNAAAGTEKWAFVPSSTDLPAATTRDVITNAIIYQKALVSPVGASRALGDQSGAGEPFSNAREPIAQVFAPAGGGEDFLFVVNHFKSKSAPRGGSTPAPSDADAGDGQGFYNGARVAQATALRDWVSEIQGDTEAVVMAGDYNSYTQEDPLQVLYDAGYADAATQFETGETSYAFQGLTGSLTRVLLNEAAVARATGADVWNINAGEAVALEYSRYNNHGTDFYAEGPYRASDHDPVKVGLSASAQAPLELTLLGMNDFHGRINADTVKFAGTIEQLRAEADGPSLLLAGGDLINASLFASSYFQDKPTIDVLNAIGLDASSVGNHEFDRGFADLTDRVIPAANYSYLGANVYKKGTTTPALPAYKTFEIEGLTVGVIGAVTESTPSAVSPSGVANLDFGDPVEAINRVADELTDGDPANGEADVLIATMHEGAPAGEPSTIEEQVAASPVFASIVQDISPKVGAMFNGHTQQAYAWEAPLPGVEGKARPIVQTGDYGKNVGEIVLTIDRATGDIQSFTKRNVARTSVDDATLAATYPRVAEVKSIVDDALKAADAVGATKVGEVTGDITTAFGGGGFVDGVWTGGKRDDRASESTLGNLVAESIRSTLADLPSGAQIGLTNSGGLRDELYDTQAEFGPNGPDLADGEISFSQAKAVLPFDNTMALVTLTGAQFKMVLEQQWQRAENVGDDAPSRPYLQLGLSKNVSYTYDASRAMDDRITSITIDGQPIDPNAQYRIGAMSFLAEGGDNFFAFRDGTDYVNTGLMDYEAWNGYLTAQSPVSPDYAKRAVEVRGSTTVAPGASTTLTVSNLNLTSLGTPETTQLQVMVDGEPVGTVPVTAGSAEVTVDVPAGTTPGTMTLTLTSEIAGTVVSVPLTVSADAGGETPDGPWATITLSSDRVEQGGLLAVTATGLRPGQMIGATLYSNPITATGIPAADASGRTAFTIAIPRDLPLGVHRLEVTSPGEEPISLDVTVVARGQLATTGAETPFGIAFGIALLLVAAGVVFVLRRRTASAS